MSPYFRHKNKKCSDFYSEPETDEHRKGKIMLFNWISQQPDIDKCELEKWLPETFQGAIFLIRIYQCLAAD